MTPKVSFYLSILAALLYLYSLFLPALIVSRASPVVVWDFMEGVTGWDVLTMLLYWITVPTWVKLFSVPLLIGDVFMAVAPIFHYRYWRKHKPNFTYRLWVALLSLWTFIVGFISCCLLLISDHEDKFLSHFVWFLARILWWMATMLVSAPFKERPSNRDFSQIQ
jgi:hypothetical protein